MLAVLWFLLASAILTGAGYSHYRYRVKNNLYYAKLFSRHPGERASATLPNSNPYALPVVAAIILGILVPALFAI